MSAAIHRFGSGRESAPPAWNAAQGRRRERPPASYAGRGDAPAVCDRSRFLLFRVKTSELKHVSTPGGESLNASDAPLEIRLLCKPLLTDDGNVRSYVGRQRQVGTKTALCILADSLENN